MPSFSSDEMYRLWRYAIDSDFHALSEAPSGKMLPTAERPMGTETTFLPFSPSSTSSATAKPRITVPPSIDEAGTKIAVAIGASIHIYDLSPSTPSAPPLILRGHVEDIRAVHFVPGSSTRLVSSSYGSALGRVGQALPPGGPEIILWDTETPMERRAITDEALDIASEAAIHTALGVLAIRSSGSGFGPRRAPVRGLPISVEHRHTLEAADEAELRETIRAALRKADTTTLVLSQNKLSGRLATSFQSTIFNHTGDRLVYLPGPSPACNGDEAWDICIRDLTPFHITDPTQLPRSLILKGHRDSTMWTGFSPDDSLLASVSWDKTIRVWDVETGEEKRCWRTEGQNWTGHWSPDGSQFLGTCGNGTIFLWDVNSGEEVWHFHPVNREHRGGWYRHVAWCPPLPGVDGDGVDLSEGLIAVGGDALGRVMLLTPHAPAEGEKKAPIQERWLSTRNMDVSEEVRRMASGFLAVTSVRFLPAPEGASDWGVKLAYTTSIEGGVEVVDLIKGKKWRIGIRPEWQEGDAVGEMEGRGQGRREIRDQVFWKYAKGTGQVLIVNWEGVRFFDLD